MTENEAKLLEKLDDLANDLEVDMYSVASLNFFFEESANTIRGLLGEIQAYRAIGTVEELKSLKENGAFTGVELAQLAVMQMRLRDYQYIGTVEELQATKEKLQGYKNQMSIYAEQHKVILASDVLDMVEELDWSE